MRGLDFLVIGAMKSGTTTLYEDLRQHPDVHLLEKESSLLAGAAEGLPPAADSARRVDLALRGAPVDALCGEVATTYAMAPHFPGVVEAAAGMAGQSPRVIYIVREPLARIISHHHHDVSSGRITTSIDDAVVDDPRLIDYTRYAEQVAPWIDLVGRDNVLLVRFESYMADRPAGLEKVLSFLGLSPLPDHLDEVVHNRSEGKPVAVGMWGRIVRSNVYRRVLRPLLPERLRRRAMSAVLPEAPPRPAPPTPKTVEFVRQQLAVDQERVRDLTTEQWWPRSDAGDGSV